MKRKKKNHFFCGEGETWTGVESVEFGGYFFPAEEKQSGHTKTTAVQEVSDRKHTETLQLNIKAVYYQNTFNMSTLCKIRIIKGNK